MKKLNIIVFGLMMIAFVACNQEQLAEQGIYAPNGIWVSASMEDLSGTIADAIDSPREDIVVESISFADVEEGYIAAVDVFIKSVNEHTQVYYISSVLEDKLNVDSSVELVEIADTRRRPQLTAGIVAYCSCGPNTTLGSSKCRVSVTTFPNGSMTGTCFNEDNCNAGCTFRTISN